MVTTGERLAAWRKLKGLSQAAAAESFGVSQGAWAAWESGTKRPDLGNALRLEPFTDGDIKAVAWVPEHESGPLPKDDTKNTGTG